MGVSGLWEFIKDAGQQRSFAHLAIKDGFEDNTSSKRAYRIGIDVSIWLRHSYYSKEGDNPQLRLLFFRLARLAELPLIPLFVFDGRQRPKVKRGSKMGKSGSHTLSKDFKEMIAAFGMEFREALGEAEAELAYLNSKGYIDAILTDDSDAFVFGGRTIIKNWSATLSGNRSDAAAQQNTGSSKKAPQLTVYSADRIRDLTRGGLILYALLNGGDYDDGVPGFGPAHSFGLARCGFGDSLLREYQEKGQHIMPFLVQWRKEMNAELASNSRGFVPRSKHRIPDNFPNLDILEFYVNPICSAGKGGGGPPIDKGEMNLEKLAGLCEKHFEWAYSPNLVKRFRDLIWPGAVMHVLRRAALEADAKEREKRARSGNEDRVIRGALKPSRAEAVGTPAALVKQYLVPPDKQLKEDRLARVASAFVNRPQASQARPEEIPDPNPLISKIVNTRRHESTGNLLEYRVEVCPVQLVELAKKGIKGVRPPPEEPPKPMKKLAPAPESMLRLWIPASIVHQVHPGLVEDYVVSEEAKSNRRPRGRGRGEMEDDEGEERGPSSSQPARRTQAAPRATQVVTLSADSESNAVIDPWFAAGDSTRFLFTFHDPDFDEDAEDGEEEEVAPSGHRNRNADRGSTNARWSANHDDMVVDNEGEDDLPRDPLDAIWDRVLDGASSRPKPRARKQRRAAAPASTRIRRDDDLLTRLDKLDARAAKRRRVVGDEIEVGAGVPMSGKTSGLRRAPWQLEPTSSQDSLLSQDIIDLT